ncbi:MAG: hypothetical protein WBD40_17770 [Tepidisphaeraceae bacterium]
MTAIKIERHLDSDTLHLPELKALIGRDVEIIVTEKLPAQRTSDLSKFFDLAGRIDLDEDAIRALREKSKL